METKTKVEHINDITVTWRVHSKRTWVGLALGLLTVIGLIFTGPWYLALAGAVVGVIHFMVARLQIQTQIPRQIWKLNIIWGVAMLVSMSFILPVMVSACTLYIPFEGKFLLNMLCLAFICCIFLAIFGDWRRAVNASVIFLIIIGTINGYVFVFRDRELTFLDIYSASTAAEVSGQYSFWPSAFVISGWSLTALGIMVQFAIPKIQVQRPGRLRIYAVVAAVASLLVLHIGSRGYYPERWRTNGSIKNGYLLNFYLGIRDANVDKPTDYSPETVGEVEQEYQDVSVTPKPGPNVLVIMNESYCDLSIYPGELTTNMPVTPYWDSLKENTIRGYALASVYGGNTANSEFEFLTGSTMGFLPNGSVPYYQYLDANTYSLAWVLEEYGYNSMAAHAYYRMGWNRDRVYPLLGFQKSCFVDEYPQELMVREYVSDREQYEFMLDMLDKQAEPAFIFGVTMQNHGGYQEPTESYNHCIELQGDYAGFDQAEQYLSLIHASDEALQYLINRLEEYPEDTVVLIFGDHQPKLEPEFYETLNNGDALDELDEQMLQHTVPFIIWANYDIAEREVGLTSLNFLAGYLLDAAGLQRTAYHSYLADVEKVIPAMNALGYYSAEQGCFVEYENATGREKRILDDYSIVQYNALFDRENSSVLFFDQYLPDETRGPEE